MIVKSTGLLFEAKKMLLKILKSTELHTFSCFTYLFLHWVFVAALRLSPVVVSAGGCSLVVVCGLLIAVASLVVEHGL